MKKERNYKISMFLVACTILFSATLLNNRIIYPDSYGYISNHITRGAGYPLFLDFFEKVFGNSYLDYVIIFQTLFLAFSICYFCLTLRKELKLSKAISFLFAIVIIIINIAPALFSNSGILMYKAICTEGLTYPLSLIFFILVIKAVFKNSLKKLNYTLPLIFLMTLIRFQTVFTLVIYIIVYIYILLTNNIIKRSIIYLPILVLTLLFSSTLFEKSYNYFINDNFVSTPFGTTSFSIKVMYISEKKDSEYITNNISKQIFIETMEKASAKGMLQETFKNDTIENNLIEMYKHYENSYDILFYRIFDEKCREILKTNGPKYDILRDKVASDIIHDLLPLHLDDYVRLTFTSGIIGLVRSNSMFFSYGFFAQNLLYFVSVVAYILSFIFMLRAFKKQNKSKTGLMMVIAYLMILGNASPSILVHFPISRYTFLAMPMFYISLFTLVYFEIVEYIKKLNY